MQLDPVQEASEITFVEHFLYVQVMPTVPPVESALLTTANICLPRAL